MGLKKAKRAIMAVALTAAIGSGVLVGTQATAQAATAYKTVSTKTLTKTAYHKKSTAGALYNQTHTKKVAALKTYPNTTWYATKQATLKHSNSKGIYYYVKNKSGSVKGWIGMAT